MSIAQAQAEARHHARIAAPTEFGFFDARVRLDAYLRYMLSCGVVADLGGLVTDAEVDDSLRRFGLD